ncbi:MAG: hypothetical protein JXM69_12470 [Anaerolineae bacterium]|nr:hypothetical protein [Anaerolineae bacterium]
MNTQNKWIIAGIIAVALVVGLTLGAVAVTLFQRVMWGYTPAYPPQSYMPGPMFGGGLRWDGPMRQGHMGRGRPGGFGPGMGQGMMGHGFGSGLMFGRGPAWGGAGSSLVAVAAEQLGMTSTDLLAELQAGKSIANIAQEKDVAVDKIVDAFLTPQTERLALMVENGVMTQEQVDTMLAAMRANITARLSNQGTPGGDNCPGWGDTDGDGVCDFARRGPGDWGGGPMGRWR